MAGLQYNFFPTDFFYPRPPQPTTPAVDSNSAPLIPRTEAADRDDGSKQPASLVQRRNNKSSVSMRRKQGQKLGRICIQNQGDQVKLPRNSVSSWLMLIPDEEEQSDST